MQVKLSDVNEVELNGIVTDLKELVSVSGLVNLIIDNWRADPANSQKLKSLYARPKKPVSIKQT